MTATAKKIFFGKPSDRLNHLPDLFEEMNRYRLDLVSAWPSSDKDFEDATIKGSYVLPSPSFDTGANTIIQDPLAHASNGDGSTWTVTTGGQRTGSNSLYNSDLSSISGYASNVALGDLVPVTRERRYSFSTWMKNTNADSTYPVYAWAVLFWYNASGEVITYQNGTQVYWNSTTAGAAGQIGVYRESAVAAATPPVGATHARIGVRAYCNQASGRNLYVDDFSPLTWTNRWIVNSSTYATVDPYVTAVSRSGAGSLAVSSTSSTTPWILYRTGDQSKFTVHEDMRYHFGAYWRAAVAGRSVRMTIEWQSSAGSVIRTDDLDFVPVPTDSWVWVGTTQGEENGVFAPVGAGLAVIKFTVNQQDVAGETLYMDDVTALQETPWARIANVSDVAPDDSRRRDPSSTSMKIVASAAGDVELRTREADLNRFDIIPGKLHLVSGYFNGTLVRNVQVGVRWYDINGVYLSESMTPSFADGTVPDEWTLVYDFFTAPPNARTAIFVVRITGAAAGETHWMDEARVTPVLFVAGANAVILKQVLVSNTDKKAAKITLANVPTGEAVGSEHHLLSGVPIGPGQVLSMDLSQVMDPSDFLVAQTSEAGVLAVTVSGVEVS